MDCAISAPAIATAPPSDVLALNWYAVYTCVRHEKRVAEQMEQRQLRSFLPLYREIHRWKDRRKEVELALFPGYVFVRIAPQNRLRVLEIPSVVHLVSFQGKPAALPDREIDALRHGLDLRVRMEPHPFLMTIPEAVCLLIQAGTLAHRGEIFVLDMGTPVRIQKLAHDLIELSGLRPGKDVRIEITRMKPGEKISEVLVDQACEKLHPTGHDKIQVIHTRSFDPGEFTIKIRSLERAARSGDIELVYRSLAALNIGFVCKDTRLPWPRTLLPATPSTPVTVSLSPTLDA